MRRIERSLLVLALLAVAGLPALGASEPAASAPAGWQAAPLWGGDVRSLVIAPTQPDLLLAGTSSGQVYRSSDGGASWRPAGPFLPFPGWVVSALAFDPNRTGTPPGRLWAGLRGVWGSGLVAYSDDLGETWISRGAGLRDQPVYSLALVPGQEGKVYAGTLDGVWGTDDGGLSWAKLTAGLPDLAKVTSLLVEPERPDTVIAGTWRRAYESTDGGRTWEGVFQGMHLDSEVFALVPTLRPGEVWASTCNWVYQSLDGGRSWTRFVVGMDERRATAFDTLPWGRLITGTVAGVYVSDDGGRHWSSRTGSGLSVQVIAHHAGRPARVFLGTEGAGVWVSDDGAETFRPSSVGMTNLRITAVAAAGDQLFVAVNHAGPASGVYHSSDGGRTFPLHTGQAEPLPPVLSLAVEPSPSQDAAPGGAVRAWAGTEKGLFEWAGEAWHRVEALGSGRVSQVRAPGGRVVARAGDGVWELREDAGERAGWRRTAYDHGAPRTASLAAPGVRPAGGTNRALETGDPRYPALLLDRDGDQTGDRARLVAGAGASQVAVELPVPASSVEAAAIDGGRLFLGTTGFGLLSTSLPEVPAAVRASDGEAPGPAAGAAGGPQSGPTGPTGVNPR
jgi:photosystem II stability/assembly factor-like uncharacterized protein